MKDAGEGQTKKCIGCSKQNSKLQNAEDTDLILHPPSKAR
jgi:hypothetical protein